MLGKASPTLPELVVGKASSSFDTLSTRTYIVRTSGLSFTWDPEKDETNQHKHDGISFEEARTVFYDDHARLAHDPDHSDGEDRFILLGISSRLNLLIVCHCYREPDSTIRIISARRANKKEALIYERFRNA